MLSEYSDVDWITKPGDIIQSAFERDHSLSTVRQFYNEKLGSENELYKIPSLNDLDLQVIPSGTLVRFRSMIQDMFDPEIYLASFEAKDTSSNNTVFCTSKYQEVANAPVGWDVDISAPTSVTQECQTFYCVSLPAENDWSQQAYKGKGQHVSSMECCEDEAVQGKGKRSFDAMEDANSTESGTAQPCLEEQDGTSEEDAKRIRTIDAAGVPSAGGTSNVVDLNLPLSSGKACLVRVYDDLDTYHVTDMVEFVGILSKDPSLAQHDCDEENGQGEMSALCGALSEDTAAERKVHNPPPSLVPRLHMIVAHKMAHSNPLLSKDLKNPVSVSDVSALYGMVLPARSDIVDLLTSALMGDKLAAEYTLLNLLSRVSTSDSVLPVGKLSLNLVSPSIAKCSNAIQGILQYLLPKSYFLPMSLVNMNTLKLTPKKNFESNRLEAGILQLTPGTHLTLDETALTAGQLDNNGCLNVQALTNIILWQKVKYDFQFHVTEIPCDVPTLVLSEGKSLLQVDCNLPLKPNSPDAPNILQALQHTPMEHLDKLRIYLGLTRMLKYQLPAGVQKELEQDFVEMRKADEHMNADLFRLMLDLARLLSLSKGQTELQMDTWDTVKRMEAERRARLIPRQ